MMRNARQVCRVGGLTARRDTPVKSALRGREELRGLQGNQMVPETLLEERNAEEMHVSAVQSICPQIGSIQPVQCVSKSVLHLSSPTFSESSRHVLPATPANDKSPAEPEAFKSYDKRVVKEEYRKGPLQEKQILALTSESAIFSSMDTTFSLEDDHDDDDDDDCDDEDDFCLASSSSSSITSPEIFRRESFAETGTFPFKHRGLDPDTRHSTFMDESFHRYQSPNRSAIYDASTILVEKCATGINNSGPEAKTQIKTDLFRSDNEIKCKTPAKLTRKRLILCKKKVCFKSPINAEIFEVKHFPATKWTIPHTIDPVQTSSPGEHKTPGEKTCRAGDVSFRDYGLILTPKRPVTSIPEKPRVFDFGSDDNSEDTFFQMMRERADKLTNAPLFPATAANHTVASGLLHSNPQYFV